MLKGKQRYRWHSHQILHRCRDEWGELIVADDGLIRSLYFDNDHTQSAMLKSQPDVLVLKYTHAMALVAALVPRPERILMIGLGGGSLAKFLLRALPSTQIHVIELRGQVIRLAQSFFEMPIGDPRLHLIEADAHDFLLCAEDHQNRYDLIVCDAFDALGPVESLQQQQTLQQLRGLLTPTGCLAVNLWNRKSDGFRHVARQYERAFDGNSLGLTLGSKNSNALLFAFNESPDRRLKQAEKVAEVTGRRFGLDLPGYLGQLRQQNYGLGRRFLSR